MPEEYRGFRVTDPQVVETARPVYEYGADGKVLVDEEGADKIVRFDPQTLVVKSGRPHSPRAVAACKGLKVGAYVPVPHNPDADVVTSASEAVAWILTRKIDSLYVEVEVTFADRATCSDRTER